MGILSRQSRCAHSVFPTAFASLFAKVWQDGLLIKAKEPFLIWADLMNIDILKARLNELLDSSDMALGVGSASMEMTLSQPEA